MTDGPHGVRPEVLWDEWNQANWTNDSCVAFPALTCLAATWNPDMSYLYGRSIGEEARYRKKTVFICSECEKIFTTGFKNTFFSFRSHKTKKLYCPNCKRKVWVIETINQNP